MLKGALLGAGKIAQTGHLPALTSARIAQRAQIVAAVEPSPANRMALTQFYPQVHFYESFHQLLTQEKIDFINICTPPQLHAEMIELAARNGLAILCEKPFCINAETAHRLQQLLVKEKRVFVPCHQYRYSPIWENFKQAVAAGADVSPSYLQFQVFRLQADQGFNHANPSWRTDMQSSGGGILADTGVHYLYLIRWMLGSAWRVSARTFQIRHHEYGVEDTVTAWIECPRGMAELTLTWAADGRHNSARLFNQSCSLIYDGASMHRIFLGESEDIPVPDASDKSHYISYYISLFEEFFEAVENNLSTEEWIAEAVESTEVLEACYRSAQTGQTVVIKER